MTIEEIVQKFIQRPVYLTNGAGLLAKLWKCSREDIVKAKRIAKGKKVLDSSKKDSKPVSSSPKMSIELPFSPEDVIESAGKFNTERVNVEKGEKELSKVCSTSPKSAKEIKELFTIDDVTTSLSSYWIKEQSNGFLVSALVKVITKDFYSKEELKDKLKELFPKEHIFAVRTNKIESTPTKDTLVIYISDDHVGMLLKEEKSIYQNSNSEENYSERLTKIVKEVINLPYTFQEILVVSLGDQMNGYNQFTTRGGHIVPSLSNKEQFDQYVSARKKFYDQLFNTGKASEYGILEVNNSNHSGNGFSYMANEYLRLYIETKYPEVVIENSESFIQAAETYSGHILILVHGKDEQHQKAGFPLNLDAKTEVFFTDHILEMGFNPKTQFCHVVKGDLHKFNENEGKNFRYVNVGSIANGSYWQEANFGNSSPGALLEIYDSAYREPIRQIIRF